ncbi:MAG: DivIVA domain-containing protein [Actinobacteria bacterium]|nr:DivIVA domain-containing protein [Actinomycetota bacterium]
MGPEITPQELRDAELKTVLRGVERAQVERILEAAADRLESLEAEVQRLRNRLDQADVPDLAAEFEAVGTEVSGILQAARDAANSMRERASDDAARWRAEAMAEAEENRRLAAADAEALRRDAWVTGTELLDQAQRLARAMRDQAERDVLTIQGEAEREAHRLTSGARREAEDVVRNATMEAEKMIVDATRRRDDIIAQANRQASAAQERTRALEQRRDELLEELENVRATLTSLEGSLEDRRDRLDMTQEPSSVKVVHPTSADASKADRWAAGETVRVVPPEDRPRFSRSSFEEATEPEEPEVIEPEPIGAEVGEEQDEQVEAFLEPEVTEEPKAVDEVETLFASLRDAGSAREDEAEESGEAEEEEPPAEEPEESHDWIEERDSRLLPITNRALRGVKKAMTELQNIALDGLRTDTGWRPAEDPIADAVRADLIALWTESYAAGHSVAELMTGSKLKRPSTPHAEAPADFAAAVGDAVREAIQGSGQGQKERQSAASRVFRLWRSDEAERWMREAAIVAYEQGIEDSLSVGASPDGR